jgi:hypothetical protein
MNQITASKLKTTTPQLLQAILDEIKLLRSEMTLLLPHDNLEDYEHPERIERSYQKAIKQYPPSSSLWK